MNMEFMWLGFDWLGTIAFALSGTLVGMSRRMDVLGLSVLSMITAVGGGMIRDVLVGMTPPLALQNPTGMVLALGTTALTILFYRYYHFTKQDTKWIIQVYMAADAIGLASFTTTASRIGYEVLGFSPLTVSLLAFITAVGGGIMRDLLAQRIPVVLRSDVYGLGAVMGAWMYCCSEWILGSQGHDRSMVLCFVFTLGIRILVIWKQWNLPKFYRKTRTNRKR